MRRRIDEALRERVVERERERERGGSELLPTM